MASKKHQKQDSTRPTKARQRRMRGHPNGELEMDSGERTLEPVIHNTHGEVDG